MVIAFTFSKVKTEPEEKLLFRIIYTYKPPLNFIRGVQI